MKLVRLPIGTLISHGAVLVIALSLIVAALNEPPAGPAPDPGGPGGERPGQVIHEATHPVQVDLRLKSHDSLIRELQQEVEALKAQRQGQGP